MTNIVIFTVWGILAVAFIGFAAIRVLEVRDAIRNSRNDHNS